MIREIRKSKDMGSEQAARMLAALFAVELSHPSRCLWLVSPWISDIGILDNTAKSFSPLERWGPRVVRLSEILATLATQGTHIVLATTPARSNLEFRRRTTTLFDELGVTERLTLAVDEEDLLHTKSIVTDDYVVAGSMNFTYFGITLREEFVQLQYDTEQVAVARMEARDRFGGVA